MSKVTTQLAGFREKNPNIFDKEVIGHIMLIQEPRLDPEPEFGYMSVPHKQVIHHLCRGVHPVTTNGSLASVDVPLMDSTV